MNDKILLSVLLIGLVVVSVTGVSTLALFHDEEVSKGNTFQAGKLDLTLDITDENGQVREYNGRDVPAFFTFDDVKPGDEGEETISYHVYDNPACVSFDVIVTEDKDNGCPEPELDAESACLSNDDGELDDVLEVMIWDDDGDNIHANGEKILVNWMPVSKVTGESLGYTVNSTTRYIGMAWRVDIGVGNEVQTDSVGFDMVFKAVQARHNDDCKPPASG